MKALLSSIFLAALQPSADDVALIEKAFAAAEKNDCASVMKSLQPLLAKERASALGGLEQPVLTLAASCDWELRNRDTAYQYALRASAFPGADEVLYRIRYAYEAGGPRDAALVSTIEAMGERSPEALNWLKMEWLWRIHNRLQDAGQKELRTRLLKALVGKYEPSNPFSDIDDFRVLHADLLVERGAMAEAKAVVDVIDYPNSLRLVMVDPALRGYLPAGFDIKQATERAYERTRTVMVHNPRLLEGVQLAAMYLRQLGRPHEALALLETVQAKVAAGTYDDINDYRSWWWDELSRAYRALWRFDDAVDALRSGSKVAEGEAPNVSQVINLAQLLSNNRRPDQALAGFDAAKLGRTSPFGAMQVSVARGCAFSQLGRKAEAAKERAFMEAHVKDAPETLVELYLCMKNYNRAATGVIAQLADPLRMRETLLEYSDYAESPVRLPETILVEGRAALKQRADVKAALAKAGGTVRFNVQPGDW